MSELGKCYYCGLPVVHSKPCDYGAFTKKWDKKSKRYLLSDFWHMSCYVRETNKVINTMQGIKHEEYRQLSLFDLIGAEE